MFLPHIVSSETGPKQYQEYLQTAFGADAEKLRELLPANSSEEVWNRLDRLISAKWFGAWAYFMATAADNGRQTWFYRFACHPPRWATKVLAEDDLQSQIPYEKLGACRSAELFYVFGFTKLLLGFFFKDWSLSEKIMRYWTNFAKSGNPNDDNLPDWPPCDARERCHYLEIGRDIEARSDLDVEIYEIIMKTWLKSPY